MVLTCVVAVRSWKTCASRMSTSGSLPAGGCMRTTVGTVGGAVAAKKGRVDVACFVQGTLIATPRGEKPIEYLKPGDQVITRDNGVQDIRWIGSRHIGWKTLSANPHLKPVVIRWGALDWGAPAHDLFVSPNHRILVRDPDGEEVLATA